MTIEKTLAYSTICPFNVQYKSVMFYSTGPQKVTALFPGWPFLSGPMFPGKARSQPWREHMKDATLLASIRLGWKGLPGANSLAPLSYRQKSLITLAPGVNVIIKLVRHLRWGQIS